MRRTILVAAVIGAFAATSARAIPISGSSLQDELTAAGASIDVIDDQAEVSGRWTVGATGVASARMLFELAGFAAKNTFGIYDVSDPHNRLQIFAGADTSGAQRILALNGASDYCAGTFANFGCKTFATENFGFYLSTPEQRTYYSETWRNVDGVQHLLTFEGGPGRGSLHGRPWLANEFVLAWEDLFQGGDFDYNDLAIVVESIAEVPEPSTLALMGVGLLAMGWSLRGRSPRH